MKILKVSCYALGPPLMVFLLMWGGALYFFGVCSFADWCFGYERSVPFYDQTTLRIMVIMTGFFGGPAFIAGCGWAHSKWVEL